MGLTDSRWATSWLELHPHPHQPGPHIPKPRTPGGLTSVGQRGRIPPLPCEHTRLGRVQLLTQQHPKPFSSGPLSLPFSAQPVFVPGSGPTPALRYGSHERGREKPFSSPCPLPSMVLTAGGAAATALKETPEVTVPLTELGSRSGCLGSALVPSSPSVLEAPSAQAYWDQRDH